MPLTMIPLVISAHMCYETHLSPFALGSVFEWAGYNPALPSSHSQGRVVSFKNAMIILTSNVGSRLIAAAGNAARNGAGVFSRPGMGAGPTDEKLQAAQVCVWGGGDRGVAGSLLVRGRGLLGRARSAGRAVACAEPV